VRLKATLGSDGSLCGVDVLVDEVGDPQFLECVTKHLFEPPPPAPGGGCLEVTVPLVFRPTPDAGAGDASAPTT
jgi:hypothetical protein